MIKKERIFDTRADLAAALAADVAAVLGKALSERGEALLAVSGGKTPALFLDKLAQTDLAWEKVRVTLVDERQVPETSERSNARLVRQHLMHGKAVRAGFVPLFENPAAARLPALDVAVLGMGTDGHTASFFPGGDRLAEAIDPNSGIRLIEITAPGAGEPRLTFTLPVLEEAGCLMLHIEGAEKKAVLQRALGHGPASEMPVRAVLRSARPLTLYWCP